MGRREGRQNGQEDWRCPPVALRKVSVSGPPAFLAACLHGLPGTCFSELEHLSPGEGRYYMEQEARPGPGWAHSDPLP